VCLARWLVVLLHLSLLQFECGAQRTVDAAHGARVLIAPLDAPTLKAAIYD